MDSIIEQSLITEFLKDESRQIGWADEVVFPTSEGEIIAIVKDCFKNNIPITSQGSKTGLAAAAVPNGGKIVNLSKMNKIISSRMDNSSNTLFITVQPGITLIVLREILLNGTNEIKPKDWFFSPDPTETSASLGGIVSCNASGAKSFMYGSVRPYVNALRIVLSDGDVLYVKRDGVYAVNDSFKMTTVSGKEISGILPHLKMPNVKKNTAGYYIKPNMDMIDLFIGSEGTLGIISSMELKLLPQKKYSFGIVAFLPEEKKALQYVRILRGEKILEVQPSLPVSPESIEFFNKNVLQLLRNAQKNDDAFSKIDTIDERFHTAVYTEFSSDDEELLWDNIDILSEIMLSLGCGENDNWVASNPKEMEKLHVFRHAAPECVNMQIDEIRKKYAKITKLGTDMAVPDDCLEKVMTLYNCDIERNNFNSVIFGHIGNNHLHVNIIPQNYDEYEKGKAMYKDWAKKITHMGGTVSSEHGVGKLKVPFLQEMFSEEALNEMRHLKTVFDPQQAFGRNNIFPYKEI